MSQRQPAIRAFAMEYNDCTEQQREEGQYSPNYVISPLGAMVNRIFIVGVLLEVNEFGDSDDPFTVARISDPSGAAFRVSAGSKKADLARKLKSMETPSFIAVVGKSNLYNPEMGVYRLSIDPEVIHAVDDKARMRWILDTARSTKERIDALMEARKMVEPSVDELVELGFSRGLAEGAVASLENYPNVDIAKYTSSVVNALSFILPEHRSGAVEITRSKPVQKTQSEKSLPEDVIMELLEVLEKKDPDGVSWDDLVESAKKKGLTEIEVEEGYVILRDRGEIMEPSIGLLKIA